MRRVLGWTASLLILFTLAMVGIVGLMRIQPFRLMDASTIALHGNDNTLLLGDFIVSLGTPTGIDMQNSYPMGWNWAYSGDTVDVWFGDTEIDVRSDNFGPYCTVDTTNTPDIQTSGTRWRGFVSNLTTR